MVQHNIVKLVTPIDRMRSLGKSTKRGKRFGTWGCLAPQLRMAE